MEDWAGGEQKPDGQEGTGLEGQSQGWDLSKYRKGDMLHILYNMCDH